MIPVEENRSPNRNLSLNLNGNPHTTDISTMNCTARNHLENDLSDDLIDENTKLLSSERSGDTVKTHQTNGGVKLSVQKQNQKNMVLKNITFSTNNKCKINNDGIHEKRYVVGGSENDELIKGTKDFTENNTEQQQSQAITTQQKKVTLKR